MRMEKSKRGQIHRSRIQIPKSWMRRSRMLQQPMTPEYKGKPKHLTSLMKGRLQELAKQKIQKRMKSRPRTIPRMDRILEMKLTNPRKKSLRS